MPELPDAGAIAQQVKARIKQIEDQLKQHHKLTDELERLRAALRWAERSRDTRGLLARDDRCDADDRRAAAHPRHARAARRLMRQPARAQR
jgi:hypothetical protein